jgi:hypothetical protein
VPPMRRLTRWAALMGAGLALVAVSPRDADARMPAKVEWASVDVPDRDDGPRVQKLLKQALGKAAKKADFGKAKAVRLTARVVEMTTEERGDVVRITCTVIGRIVGGKGARSRISYGGSPEKRQELEQEVLTQVARGLVGRLAQIVRTEGQK